MRLSVDKSVGPYEKKDSLVVISSRDGDFKGPKRKVEMAKVNYFCHISDDAEISLVIELVY